MDIHVFESIVTELGFGFKVVSNDLEGESYDKIPGDIVRLFDQLKSRHPMDALILWDDNWRQIRWADLSKAAVCKMLTGEEDADDANTECAVCLEDYVENEIWCSTCPQCNCSVCIVCLLKIALQEEESQFKFVLTRDMIDYQCVECRKMHQVDVNTAYVAALYRFSEFDKALQELFLMVKSKDIHYSKKVQLFQQLFFFNENEAKKLSIGTKVVLHSLKNKSDWNGEFAHICGKKVRKHGVTKWPIRCILPPHKKCLLKSENFESLDRQRIRHPCDPPAELKIGTKVILHGLKCRTDWNGKTAEITGEKMIKNGVTRWPIELVESPKEKASMRRVNFRGLGKKLGINLVFPLNYPMFCHLDK